GARMYDPKYGIRWTGVDPLAEKYLNLSPYAYCMGNPIKFVDPNGEKIYFAPGVSQEFMDKFALTIQYMNERGSAGDIAILEKSHNIYWISEGDAHFNSRTNTISWNPQQILKTDKDIYIFPATILAHEVRHGRQKEEKTAVEFQEQSRKSKQNPYENDLEKEVISTTEQDAARKHGDISANQTTRENHQGQLIEISTPEKLDLQRRIPA
ncbi:RHS repeat-associated core domain-containing protein, partial [Alistipes sp.]|uniref:RHS repeat domain-containing protein n=1 Tax=Alistipes sp. TaxID=1872444 RepID=UPI0025C038FE